MNGLYQKEFIPKHRKIGKIDQVLLVHFWGILVPKVVITPLGNEATKALGVQPGRWAASSWV